MSYIEAYSEPGPAISANANSQSVITFNGVHRAFVEVTGIGPKGDKGDQGEPGLDGGISEFVFGETPAGLVNGSNATYTTAFDFVPESVVPSINGLEQKAGTHFITMGNDTIIFNDSPTTGEIITVTYIKS